MKIVSLDLPREGDSNDIIYIKLFQEMMVMQALLVESEVS
jgi:hypothetical protein